MNILLTVKTSETISKNKNKNVQNIINIFLVGKRKIQVVLIENIKIKLI